MPVLLLAQGDPRAKDLLRRAIEARYGASPPAIESLDIEMKGRARARIGPVAAWIPLEIQARFRFPSAMRWDFIARPVGVAVQRGVDAFDGAVYRRQRGSDPPDVIQDQNLVQSVQCRLWVLAALFLTPLGEHFVRLSHTDDHSFEAANTLINDAVRLRLRPNFALEQVEVTCLNPDSGRHQRFSLRLSAEQGPVDGMMLPRKISAFWDDEPYFEAEPVRVVSNSDIADGVFALVDSASV
ncbi:MAG: hypothetical protein ACUVSX_07635 [Aggregatilineales bacterium]